MPPRIKVKREDIINSAVKIVRERGWGAINARDIAKSLNCSTQPIFWNFKNLDELKFEIIKRAEDNCQKYIQREIEKGEYPAYKASGMAYIRFAKEEKELFRLLYMRDRASESIEPTPELNNQMEDIVHKNTGLDGEKKKLFHLEMWAFVHGIATMFATNFVDMEWEIVSKMLTDAYEGLKKRYEME